jgi:hypothetical protein
MPAFSFALAACALIAFWQGGDLQQGLISFAIIGSLGVVFAVGGRSETIRGLRGDGRDEYWARLDLGATAIAGCALIVAVIGMCFWEWAHGRDGSPYAELGAVAGATYVLALVGLRLRG